MVIKSSRINFIILWMFCKVKFGDLIITRSLSRSFVRRHSYIRAMKSDDSMSEQPIPLPSQNILGKQVIVLAGATSVGKSACAAELCKIYDAEIVIADSVQVNKPNESILFSDYGEVYRMVGNGFNPFLIMNMILYFVLLSLLILFLSLLLHHFLTCCIVFVTYNPSTLTLRLSCVRVDYKLLYRNPICCCIVNIFILLPLYYYHHQYQSYYYYFCCSFYWYYYHYYYHQCYYNYLVILGSLLFFSLSLS